MKSRPLITTFSAVLVAFFLSSAICAQTKSNTWLKGTWEGTGYQTDDQSTWTMLLAARGGRFLIDYPSLNCGGRWQLISINAYRARFKERLDHGEDKCTDKGIILNPERFSV